MHIYDKEASRDIVERIKDSYMGELKGILDKVGY